MNDAKRMLGISVFVVGTLSSMANAQTSNDPQNNYNPQSTQTLGGPTKGQQMQAQQHEQTRLQDEARRQTEEAMKKMPKSSGGGYTTPATQ